MRRPLSTRPGVVPEPTEPWRRRWSEPCDFGPRVKWCRCTGPEKPLPFEMPVTWTLSPVAKLSTPIFCPGTNPVTSSRRTSRRCLKAGRSLRWPRSPFDIFLSAMAPKPICTAVYPSRSLVATRVTRFDSVAMTVAPTTDPSGRKCWSMPTLRPMMTAFVIAGAAVGPLASVVVVVSSVTFSLLLEFYLDVAAGRKIELHECVDGLLRWIVDVDEALVRPDLELLARVLVDERAADQGQILA